MFGAWGEFLHAEGVRLDVSDGVVRSGPSFPHASLLLYLDIAGLGWGWGWEPVVFGRSAITWVHVRLKSVALCSGQGCGGACQ